MKHNEQYVALDLLRGMAALAVCAGHLRNFMFVDFRDLVLPGAMERVFYFATSVGHSAVIVFFVLSGYFVGGSVWRLASRGQFDWWDYLLARLTRLWVVLLPALVFTLLFDALGASVAPGSGVAKWDQSLPTFLGNALFLQTIAVPVFGSNGPLWSLANEFWYYIAFPFLALGLVRRSVLWLLPMAIGGAVLWKVQPEIPSGFLFWLMGWTAALRDRVATPGWRFISIAIAIFLGALAAAKFLDGFLSELTVAAATWMLLCVLPHVRVSDKAAPWATGLSEMSYSLYLFHFPLAAFLFMAPVRIQPSPFAYLQFLLGLAAMVGFGYVMWWLFERHTDGVRCFLRNRIGIRKARAR